jgi:hypothetical protein
MCVFFHENRSLGRKTRLLHIPVIEKAFVAWVGYYMRLYGDGRICVTSDGRISV